MRVEWLLLDGRGKVRPGLSLNAHKRDAIGCTVLAHLAKAVCAPETGAGWHRHEADFHWVTLTKGWARLMHKGKKTVAQAFGRFLRMRVVPDARSRLYAQIMLKPAGHPGSSRLH